MWQKLSLRAADNLLWAFVLTLGLASTLRGWVLEAAPRVQAEDQSVHTTGPRIYRDDRCRAERGADPDARLDRIVRDLSRLSCQYRAAG